MIPTRRAVCCGLNTPKSLYQSRFFASGNETKRASVRRRTFSGIQPTGIPHLGNYLGALVHWVRLQNDPQSAAEGASTSLELAVRAEKPIYCVVDLHALTVPQDPKALRRNTLEMAASLLAVGIDPARSILYRQSKVPQHAELGWLLMCITPISWLNRMHQWKTKEEKETDSHGACLGLLGYPALQAADILLFKATDVPVGEDQMQHLNLARDIAQKFNHLFGPVFPVPDALLANTSAKRIMSLRDPMSKMSKSDISDQSRINITDDADSIKRKIQRATTDSFPTVDYNPVDRPGVAGLMSLYAGLANIDVEQVADTFRGKQTRELKEAVTEVCVERLKPVREKFDHFRKDDTYVERMLQEGEGEAKEIAARTMKQVRKAVGLH